MRLWDYLSARMERYADRVAFANAGLTYADILRIGKPQRREREFRLCEGKTREETALAVLCCLAEGDVAVPVSLEYGANSHEYIRQTVATTKTSPNDLAFVMFTSGTTGKPKGVMLTDENICANLDAIGTYFDLRGCESICIARPLVHIAVLTGELLYALINGLTVYFYEEAFMPQRLLAYIERHGIEVMCGTPTLLSALSKVSTDRDVVLKVCAISGEILTENTARQLSTAFPNTEFYNVYGLTEHSPRVSALLPHEFAAHPGSVGKPISGVEIKIQDGELLVKSQSIMKGYLDDRQSTQAKVKDGWLYTADAAHTDIDGYIYIEGRKDNMIIRSGLNIYPEEIERAAMEMCGIEDCVVFGEASEYGTVICLKYVGDIEPQSLRKLLLKSLHASNMPNKIERVEKLPRTASGKKLRK